MRFVVDANLSPLVAAGLRAGGHDAVHVADIGLLTASDEMILATAAEDDRVIVSADADFAALLALGHLAKPSFVLLRSADHLTSSQQADLLLANLSAVSDDLKKERSSRLLGDAYASEDFRSSRRSSAVPSRRTLACRSLSRSGGPTIRGSLFALRKAGRANCSGREQREAASAGR